MRKRKRTLAQIEAEGRAGAQNYLAAKGWKELDSEYWRHGITINLGNGWNVTKEYAHYVLNYIAKRLLRSMFGNNWRNKSHINLLGFGQGSTESFNRHWHVLAAIEGQHQWDDTAIGKKIEEITKRGQSTDGKNQYTLIGDG